MDAVAGALSAAAVSKNEDLAPPRPCSSRTSGPSPIVSVEIRLPRWPDVVDAQQRRAAVGEAEHALEADREVEVAARVEAALRERLDAGELALAQREPGLGVRADDDVGLAAGHARRARGRRASCSGPPSVWPTSPSRKCQVASKPGVGAEVALRQRAERLARPPPGVRHGRGTVPGHGRPARAKVPHRAHDSPARQPLRAASCRSSRATPGRVGIYACGPTVYGRIHVGNARPVRRLLAAQALPRARGPRGARWWPTSPTSTTRSTPRRAKAGVASEALAAEMTAAYIRPTPSGSGSAGPTTSRWPRRRRARSSR